MALLERIKHTIEGAREGWRHWRTFREIDEGHRYQSRYHFHQRRRRKGLVSVYRRPLSLVCGPILIIAGFVFIPTPGPSYIIIAIGFWLLAGEFLLLACLFDRGGAGGEIRTVVERPVERLAHRVEGPGRSHLRRPADLRGIQAVRWLRRYC
jgi:Putative transmembrane protein (PGPGW)